MAAEAAAAAESAEGRAARGLGKAPPRVHGVLSSWEVYLAGRKIDVI